MNMNENERCPFCGSCALKADSKGKNINYMRATQTTMSIRCKRCHARGPTVGGLVAWGICECKAENVMTREALEELAWKRWNERALR